VVFGFISISRGQGCPRSYIGCRDAGIEACGPFGYRECMASPPLKRIRIASLLLPPLGLVLLWRSREVRLGRKIFGSVGVLFYSVIYAALVVAILMLVAGLEIEWRGGFPPVLTFRKTKPNYESVEKHRARQTNAPLQTAILTSSSEPYWTDFRGPRRDGHYAERPILTDWPAGGLRTLWRQPIGGGYASFVIAAGRAFTLEQRRDREAVTAYDLATGRELWAHSYPAAFSESMGGDGPRATPTWHDGRLYSLGAEGEFCCLEAASGKLLWRKNVLAEARAKNLYFALSTSPLIVDDTVIVLSGDPDGGAGNTVFAFHKVTGERVWAALNERLAYTSPMLVTLASERQILLAAATRLVGLKPEDGSVLWDFPWKVQYDNSIAQPVLVGTNRFLISGGYGTGCALVEIVRQGDRLRARQVWKNQNLKNKFNSSVFHDGFVYGLDEGILTCIDAATGARRWKDGRYGYGQLLLADGHLLVLGGDGELALVKASPDKLVEVAKSPGIRGKTWNHPAIAAGRLLVRNAVEMACFDLEAR